MGCTGEVGGGERMREGRIWERAKKESCEGEWKFGLENGREGGRTEERKDEVGWMEGSCGGTYERRKDEWRKAGKKEGRTA